MDNSKSANYTLPLKGLSARPWNIQTIYDVLKKCRDDRQAERNLYMQARQWMTALYECFEEELDKIPIQSLNPDDRKKLLREVNNYNQRLFKWLGAGQDKERLDPTEHESVILEYNFLVTQLRDLQQPAGTEREMDQQEKDGQSKNWHNDDFTEVFWNGKRYKFNKPQQVLSVEYLWKNKRAREKSIGEAIGSEADNFRLIHIFRQKSTKPKMHPAWGTMIVPDGKGVYALAECKKAPKK